MNNSKQKAKYPVLASKEEAVLSLAKNLISAALSGRDTDGVIDRAERSEAYLQGEQPARTRPEPMGNKVYNKYAELFSSRASRMSQTKIKWKFGGEEDDDLLTAYLLNKTLGDVVWDYIEWDGGDSTTGKSEQALIEAMHAGTVHLKLGLDRFGWPSVDVLTCEQVAPDPQAKKFEDLQYVCFFFAKRIEEIELKYGIKLDREPEYGKKITGKNYVRPSTILSTSNYYQMEDVWARLDKGARSKNIKTIDDIPVAVVCEIWLNDLTTIEIPFDQREVGEENDLMARGQEVKVLSEQNHPKHIKEHFAYMSNLDPSIDNNIIEILKAHIAEHQKYPQVTKKLKYPDGRLITVSQGKLLRDTAFPFGRHWRDFLVKIDWEISRNNYWGKSFGHDLFDRQDALNHRKNSITANINMLNMGIRKVRKGLFKTMKAFTNMIGKTYDVTDPNDITVDFGKELPSQFFNDVVWEENGMERQSGNEQVLSGRLPAPGTSNAAIENLIQQGLIRSNAPTQHYLNGIKKMAKTFLYIITTFKPDGLRIEYKNPADGQQIIFTPDRLKEIVGIEDIRIGIKFDETTQETRFNRAVELYVRNIYSVQEVLEEIDDPKKGIIMQRRSEIELLKNALSTALTNQEKLQSMLNTERNRSQDEKGQGNVGIGA